MFVNARPAIAQTQVTFWRPDSLLSKIKPSLYHFFEEAFRLGTRNLLVD